MGNIRNACTLLGQSGSESLGIFCYDISIEILLDYHRQNLRGRLCWKRVTSRDNQAEFTLDVVQPGFHQKLSVVQNPGVLPDFLDLLQLVRGKKDGALPIQYGFRQSAQQLIYGDRVEGGSRLIQNQ